jgi:hypothetical protein
MEENFICNKNKVLLIKNEEGKVVFAVKVLKDKPFYNKLENRFMKMFSNSEEVKVIKKEFKKNKGIIDILVNTGGGMHPYYIFKYKIEKVELI